MTLLKHINPPTLRKPTKAYSQGIVIPLGVADLMFVTGQLSQDMEGNVIAPHDAEAQAKVIFSRIEDILNDGEMTLENIVKAQVFLTNIKDAPLVSGVRDKVFKTAKPTSTLVEVSNLVKEGCCVEIEVTAIKFKKEL